MLAISVALTACTSPEQPSAAATPAAAPATAQAAVDQRAHEQQAQALAQCQRDFETYKASPGIRLAKAQELANAGKLKEAIAEYGALIEANGTTAEAATARTLLAAAVKQQAAAEAEQRRRLSLGFKALKEAKSVDINDITVHAISVATGRIWTYDGHGDGYVYSYYQSEAERGATYVFARFSISAKSKNPELPPMALYRIDGDKMEFVSHLSYRFRRWEQYGTYLGNYHDSGNDFAYSSTIAFTAGYEVNLEAFEQYPHVVVVQRKQCVDRRRNPRDTPEISYGYGLRCATAKSLSLADFDNDYAVIKMFNKSKL